ncbi:Oxidoreductase [Streptomyces misionensis JCM 4497]
MRARVGALRGSGKRQRDDGDRRRLHGHGLHGHGRGRPRPGHRPGAPGRLPRRAGGAGPARRGPPRRDPRAPGHLAHLPHGQAAPPAGAPGRQDRPRPRRHRGHGHRLRRAHRRRDRGHPALLQGRARPDRGDTPAPALLLHLQVPLRRGRLLLPPALSEVRRAEPGQAGRPRRPHRQARPAHRRPGQDRHVHRAAAAARRRAHDDHHPVPQGRHPPLQGDGGLRGLAAPPGGRRHRPARPGAGGGPGRAGRRGGSAGHPDQQRDADRAPPALGVRRPGRRRERAAARGRTPRAPRHRRLQLGSRGRHRRAARRHQRPGGAEGRRPGARRGQRQRRPAPGRHGHRRRRPGAGRRGHQHLGAEHRADLPGGAAGDPAVQLHGALHPDQQAAPGHGRGRPEGGAGTVVRRQRLRDGGGVQPRLQGRGAPEHQRRQGGHEHGHADQRAGDVRHRRDPDDVRRHRLDHRRAPALRQAAPGRGRLPRASRPGRRRGPRLRPDRARRGGRGRVRRLPEGLRARQVVTGY